MRHLPNALTLSRFPLAIAMLALYYFGMPAASFAVAAIACLTDWIDGRLARALHCESAFGSEIDPYADKTVCWAMTAVVLIAFGAERLLMVPIAIIAMYDAGLGVLRFAYGRKNIPTNGFAKKKTTALMIALIMLYVLAVFGIPSDHSLWMLGAGGLLIASYFAIRAAAEYLRAFGIRWVPSIPYVL